MPIYKVNVQAYVLGNYISNRYEVYAASIAAAADMAPDIADIQSNILPDSFYITKINVETPEKRDGIFWTQDVSIQGKRHNTSALLPLFNRFRVDFGVPFRRPLRKYLVGVCEEDTADGDLTNVAIQLVDTQYSQLIVGLGYVVNPTGTHITQGNARRQVGMHQLRRGSKRKARPII